MTIRRLLVLLDVPVRLFFYYQLKDIDSNHWIETAFPWGLNTGSNEGRRHVAQPLPHPSMPGSCDPYRMRHPPVGGDTGMWTLLFAAGMAGEQPSAIKAQGPFHGPFVAESILDTIVESLTLHGYELADDPQIWCLHLQAQLREINGGRYRSAT